MPHVQARFGYRSCNRDSDAARASGTKARVGATPSRMRHLQAWLRYCTCTGKRASDAARAEPRFLEWPGPSDVSRGAESPWRSCPCPAAAAACWSCSSFPARPDLDCRNDCGIVISGGPPGPAPVPQVLSALLFPCPSPACACCSRPSPIRVPGRYAPDMARESVAAPRASTPWPGPSDGSRGATSGIVTCRTSTRYVPVRTRYVLCYSIIPPCTAPFEYVLFTAQW